VQCFEFRYRRRFIVNLTDEMCDVQGIKDSSRYVEQIIGKIVGLKYSVVNVSISVEAKTPRLKMEIIKQIKNRIASLLKIRELDLSRSDLPDKVSEFSTMKQFYFLFCFIISIFKRGVSPQPKWRH